MSGFEFTPGGIVPLGAAVIASDPSEPAPAVVRRAAPTESAPIASTTQQSSSASAPPRGDAGKALTAKEILAPARARLRELERLVPTLTKERDMLRALLASTKRGKRLQ